jgi:MFS family permease
MDAMTGRDSAAETDSAYAWRRLACTLMVSTIGGVGMWSFIVALPTVQADFGITRADASLPYTLLMLGFGVGGIFMGKLADRRGIVLPLLIAIAALGAGYVLSAFTTNIWQLALVHGVLLGLCGTSVMFAPLMADISHWFVRRRGIAISIAASGNYIRARSGRRSSRP